jgi:FkbM family methyltransferase
LILKRLGVNPLPRAIAQTELVPKGRRLYLDLGARNGDTLRSLQVLYDKCIAFEPNLSMFNQMKEQKYPMCASIELYPMAAWTRDDNLTFYEDKRSSAQWGSSIIKRPDMNDRQRVELTVPCVNISRVLASLSSDFVVAMKIDIEGAEFEVIRHLLKHPYSLRRVRFAIVEWHDRYMPQEASNTQTLKDGIQALGIKLLEKPNDERSQVAANDPFALFEIVNSN